jgi:VWFA-related protein
MSCRRDKATPRARVAMLLLAGVLAPLRAERPASAQTQPKVPTFPSQVELITVDAVVIDENGRPVPGLTKEDFVVKEDGRVQEIESFEAFVLEPAEAPSEPSAVASNEPAARSSNGRAFAILVDDVRIAPERTQVARSAVVSFLERSVREGDLVTLRTSSGDVSWTARVPEGTEDLISVLSRLRGRDVEPQSMDRLTEYEAFQIANREDAPSMSGGGPTLSTGGASGRAPAQPSGEAAIAGTGLGSTKERVKRRWLDALLCTPSNCDSLVRARAMEIDAQRKGRMRVTLQAVRRELAALALDHGRKSLLLLSDGFLEDYGSDLREVAAASREANAAIYFLDVRGLVAVAGFGAAADVARFSLPDPRDQAALRFEDATLAAAGAETLADDTGGFSVRHTNDLAAGMERIAKESRVFYMLGFYPPAGKSARQWRKLSVEVNKPGLKVRARRGYTLRVEAAAARPAKKGKPKPGPDPAVVPALDSAHDAPGIPLRAMAYVLEPRPKDTVHVLVAAELDASRLAVQPKAGAQVARLDVSVVAVGRDSGRGFRHDDKVELSLPAGENPGWRALVREFELPAGVTQVRVVVRDATSGAMGSVSQRFEVPLPGRLRLSTPILTDRVEPAPDGQGLPRPALAVHRVFPSEGGLYVQFEVFGAARDPRQGAPRVTAGLELWGGGGRLARKVDPTPIVADRDGRVVRQVGISLEGMDEGPYDLVLDVRDEVSGAGLKHRESLALTRSPSEPRGTGS